MKRVLIVTYYWPPAGGPGVQRWLHFVRYFKEFGIDPWVYIPENPTYPVIDNDLTQLVPEGLQVLSQPIREPYALAKKLSAKRTQTLSKGIISSESPSTIEQVMLYIRGNLYIPDARVGWVKPSVARLKQEIPKHDIQALITTGPPHSLHLIGQQLKKQLGIPWLADFRDPWTTIHYHSNLKMSKLARSKHKRLEREVLESADLVVATSKHTAREFGGISGRKVEVVTNGYEDTHDLDIEPDDKFTVSHLGTLLSDRDPEALWMAIGELIAEDTQFESSFSLDLYGNVSEEVLETIYKHIPQHHVHDHGYVTHKEVLIAQRRARVLLLIEMNREETMGIIPGKLFEYLSAGRPIIALGPKGSEVAEILSESGSGTYYGYQDKMAIKQDIKGLFKAYKAGSLGIEAGQMSKYSRRNLTGQMAGLIDSLISETPA